MGAWMGWCLASLAVAGAAEPPPVAEGAWSSWGNARLSAETLGALGLDAHTSAEAEVEVPGFWLSSRLISGVGWEGETLLGELELELLNGRVLGDVTPVGTGIGEDPFAVGRADSDDLLRVVPRKARVGTEGEWGRLSLGADTFRWGTGMLAHDGRDPGAFGDARRGNAVGRLGTVLTPWRPQEDKGALRGMGFIAAGDVVIRDDNADLLYGGDLALQVVGGVFWQTPRSMVGGLAIARWQEDRPDARHPATERPQTSVLPLDAYARLDLADGDATWRPRLEAEVVRVTGRTDRLYGEETQAGAQVHSLGALMRAHVEGAPGWARLELGYASGDNDPRDAVVRTFRFHSDHNVGLVLFEQVLPLLSARSADRLADPGLLGVPPAGLRHVVDQGTVHNAMYAAPVLAWTPGEVLDLRAGWVWARAAGDLADPYQSALNGGWNATWGGRAPGSRDLGHELDLSARATLDIRGASALSARVEGALFLPGAAFDGLDLGPVSALRGSMEATW